MTEFIPMPADNVIGIRVADRISEQDMAAIIEAVEEKLATHDKLRVYVEYDSFPTISAKALAADVKFAIPRWRSFEKKAVVSDKDWMGKVAKVADKLFPSLELRHYPTSQKADALAWVQE